MRHPLRQVLLAAGCLGLAALFTVAVTGLPPAGEVPHPYGERVIPVAVAQDTANAVASVTFDQRGFDTLGEEFVLFASALAAVLLLRRMRDEDEVEAEHDYREPGRFDALRLGGLVMLPVSVLVGGYVVAHGHVSPGGGFQGGVVLATGLHLAYLAGDHRTLERLRPVVVFDVVEAAAAALFVVVGLAAMVSGAAFLTNVLPTGHFGQLLSAGTVPILNVVVGAEVASAVVLLLTKFLEQALLVRSGSDG